MSKWIHNISEETKTYQGRPIEAGTFFQIPPNLEIEYADDDTLVDDLTVVNPLVVMSKDGSTNLSGGGAKQVRFLQNNLPTEVTTQLEKDDKDLKVAGCFALTDTNGVADAKLPIPSDGRWIAYGDAEFETRHFFDRVIDLFVSDDDRAIAWMIALQIDPQATEPVSDETVRAMGDQVPGGPFPDYPRLDDFIDDELPAADPVFEGGPPAWFPGMTMTFKYEGTEIGPVGGYAFIPGNFYLHIKAKKGERCPVEERAGVGLAVSIDGAKSK